MTRLLHALLLFVVIDLGLPSAQEPSALDHPTVGLAREASLERLGVKRAAIRTEPARIRYGGLTKFLDGARTAVTATFDDSSKAVPNAIDALDKYGVKATIAVSTQTGAIAELWPRLRAAVENGHEIGSHARRHLCQWPDTETFCRSAFSRDEVEGSRDDLLAQTGQKYVWTWVYPCGNCAGYEFVHRRLNDAGYLVARTYPDERRGGHLVPDLHSWAADPYAAAYSQVVQRQGGIAPAGRTDVAILNRKFDDVHGVAADASGQTATSAGRGRGAGQSAEGGIYHFVTHPSLLDFGVDQFYEKHLAYIGARPDVWYVPLGPLYAYRIVRENTVVTPLDPKDGWERFAVHNILDPKVYDNALTLQFVVPAASSVAVRVAGRPLPEKVGKVTDRWNTEYYRRDGNATLVTIRPNQVVELKVTE